MIRRLSGRQADRRAWRASTRGRTRARITAGVLCLIAALAAAGCSGSPDPGEERSPEEQARLAAACLSDSYRASYPDECSSVEGSEAATAARRERAIRELDALTRPPLDGRDVGKLSFAAASAAQCAGGGSGVDVDVLGAIEPDFTADVESVVTEGLRPLLPLLEERPLAQAPPGQRTQMAVAWRGAFPSGAPDTGLLGAAIELAQGTAPEGRSSPVFWAAAILASYDGQTELCTRTLTPLRAAYASTTTRMIRLFEQTDQTWRYPEERSAPEPGAGPAREADRPEDVLPDEEAAGKAFVACQGGTGGRTGMREPKTCDLLWKGWGDAGYWTLIDLSWEGWGSSSARAEGVWAREPFVGEGPVERIPVEVELSDRVEGCDGHPWYATASISADGKAPGSGNLFTCDGTAQSGGPAPEPGYAVNDSGPQDGPDITRVKVSRHADRASTVSVSYCDRSPGDVNDFSYTVALLEAGEVIAADSEGAQQTSACDELSLEVSTEAGASPDAYIVIVDNHTNSVSAVASGGVE